MIHLIHRFWHEEDGAIVVSEITLILTIVVLGLIVGLSALRDSLVAEIADTAATISAINQSYSFAGFSGQDAQVGPSEFQDAADFCDDGGNGDFERCISVLLATSEG